MRALLLGLAVLTSAVLFVPSATAYPCEVPGCQIGPVAQCLLDHAKPLVAQPKAYRQVLEECTTVPA